MPKSPNSTPLRRCRIQNTAENHSFFAIQDSEFHFQGHFFVEQYLQNSKFDVEIEIGGRIFTH